MYWNIRPNLDDRAIVISAPTPPIQALQQNMSLFRAGILRAVCTKSHDELHLQYLNLVVEQCRALVARWTYDLLEEAGEAKLREIVNDIKGMAAAL